MKEEQILEEGIQYTVITYNGGTQHWILNNLLDRIKGPAVVGINTQKWYQKGLIHREDGPAITNIDGTQAWWINGNKLPVNSQQEFEQWLKLKVFQ